MKERKEICKIIETLIMIPSNPIRSNISQRNISTFLPSLVSLVPQASKAK